MVKREREGVGRVPGGGVWGHMQPEGDNGAGGLGGQGRLPRSRAGGSAWTSLSWLEVSWGQPGGGSLGLVPCVGSPEQKLLHILFLGGPTLQVTIEFIL